MRCLVLHNPASSRGHRADRRDRLARALQRQGLDFEIVATASRRDAARLVELHGPEFDTIVVAGGDGTIHEAVQGLDLQRHVLGVLPSGTGNDFAWMNAIPTDLDAAAAVLRAGSMRQVDLGVLRVGGAGAILPASLGDADRHVASRAPDPAGGDVVTPSELRVINSVGVGFEGRVNYESHRIRGLRGPAVYLAAVARALAHRRAQSVAIDWDTGVWNGEVFLVSACIGQRVGGAFRLAPDAHNDDGQFDVCIAGKLGLWRILALLPRTFRGTHVNAPGVQVLRTAGLTVAAPAGIAVHIDGEFVGLDVRELQLQILPRALRVLSPERRAQDAADRKV